MSQIHSSIPAYLRIRLLRLLKSKESFQIVTITLDSIDTTFISTNINNNNLLGILAPEFQDTWHLVFAFPHFCFNETYFLQWLMHMSAFQKTAYHWLTSHNFWSLPISSGILKSFSLWEMSNEVNEVKLPISLVSCGNSRNYMDVRCFNTIIKWTWKQFKETTSLYINKF